VRRVTFGKNEKRQFLDIRRSVNLSASLGGASADERADLLANAMNHNSALHDVYTPATVAQARKMKAARDRGDVLLEQELGRKAK
jgi:hypothetical protein